MTNNELGYDIFKNIIPQLFKGGFQMTNNELIKKIEQLILESTSSTSSCDNYLEIAKKSIRKNEGLELKVYACPTGKLTIGFGRNLEDNGISENEAELLLENDIEKINNQVKGFGFFSYLSDNRKAVIIDMVYNLGIEGFKKFKKTIAFLEKRDYENASMEMLNSKWAKQVGKRAIKLSKLLKIG